ncbi:MAG: replicative DNA helicase [Myxococcota bacterium]
MTPLERHHRHIYRAMETIANRGQAIDVVTLVELMSSESKLEAVGGMTALTALATQVPTAANIKYYAEIVRKKAVLRKIIAFAGEIAEECYGDVGDIEEFLSRAEGRMFSLTEGRLSGGYRHMKDVVKGAFEQIESLYEKGEAITGVPSGYIDLDAKTSGWQPSDLIIIAARPAMGKTALTLNMACNAATRFGRSVLFCSLEMSSEQLAMRLLASEARIELGRLRTGQIKEKEWARLMRAATDLSKARIFLDDTAGLSPQVLATRARRLKAEHGLDIVVIDYLQLMETLSANINSREQQISDISRKLKMLAKDLEIPVIALAQLNRGVESRSDKRPMLSDLRESGAIEQDADIISFVYRDEYYHEDSEAKGITEVIIGKHRGGSTGTVMLRFFPEFTRFENLAQDAEVA